LTERKKKFSRDKESKIRAIIDATIELINEKSPAGFSVNEIPDKAGLSIGTVYRYFPRGKDDIIAEILRKNIAGFIKLVETSTKDATSIDEAWTKIIKAYVGLKREYLSIDAFLVEAAPRGSELFKELTPMVMDFYGALNKILSRFDSFGDLSEEQINIRLGLSFSLMRAVIRGQSVFPVFESDENLLGYLLRVVQATFEPHPMDNKMSATMREGITE
jgi:AcrR family transcriptional regulator